MNIKLDYNQRKEIFSKMEFPENEPEMTIEESAFLSGLINEYKPKTVVEVGVAGGGTSAIILQCLENNRKKYDFYAVDISERLYKDNTKKTGYLGEEASKILELKYGTISIMLGKPLVYFLSEIVKMGKIDFVLLDTMHMIPGEILDFLLVFPFLSDGAIVCLHDISLNVRSALRINEIATNALFNSVVADKIINYNLVSDEMDTYPNIAAFRINKDTRKYITNIFGLLLFNWEYMLSKEIVGKYRDEYVNNYDRECIEIFDRSYMINKKIPKGTKKERLRKAAKVLLYGKY